MALLMGVVMDLLDFGPKLCAKWYFLRHKMIERHDINPSQVCLNQNSEFWRLFYGNKWDIAMLWATRSSPVRTSLMLQVPPFFDCKLVLSSAGGLGRRCTRPLRLDQGQELPRRITPTFARSVPHVLHGSFPFVGTRVNGLKDE